MVRASPCPASSRPQPLPESALLANTPGSPFQGRCFPTELADAVTGPGFDRRGIAAVSECIDEPMTRFLVFFSALPGYSLVFIASQPDERI